MTRDTVTKRNDLWFSIFPCISFCFWSWSGHHVAHTRGSTGNFFCCLAIVARDLIECPSRSRCVDILLVELWRGARTTTVSTLPAKVAQCKCQSLANGRDTGVSAASLASEPRTTLEQNLTPPTRIGNVRPIRRSQLRVACASYTAPHPDPPAR